MVEPEMGRDLLFGILALQVNLISRDELVAARSAWSQDKGKSLADVLVERRALTPEQRALIEPLVAERLREHQGDVQASLDSTDPTGATRLMLGRSAVPEAPSCPTTAAATPSADDDGSTTISNVPTRPVEPEGRFRVLRAHARGGLGEVFVARDLELNREVALKEIQERHADHADSRSRFLMEAEITGGLEHPGIVPVYSLGHHPDGRPFYAMRFIRGESFKEAIEDFHRADARGRRDPADRTADLKKLLRRFFDVCNAVAYAHSRGVIHRDIKPANIMLGPFGETLVVDWGLAKPLGRPEGAFGPPQSVLRPAIGQSSGTPETIHGSALGTPGFMSPEQASGDLDKIGPASDIYSLGATLYALLTGKAPHSGSPAQAILYKVQRGEFPRPREIKPDVPPPLEAICLRAMALDPSNRYSSARALAEDVERWLDDDPVEAYPEPLSARLGRWGRRHKQAVGTGFVALLLGVLGLAIATLLIEGERRKTDEQRRLAVMNEGRANEQAKLARTNEARANEQTKLALASEAKAKRQEALASANAVKAKEQETLARASETKAKDNEVLARASEAKAKDNEALARASEAKAKEQRELALANYLLAQEAADTMLVEVGDVDLADVPQMESVRRRLLEKARYAYERFLEQGGTDPLVRWGAGRALGRLGDILAMMGDAASAEQSYRRAIKMLHELVAAEPASADYRRDLARVQHGLGVLLKQANRFRESETFLRDSLRLRQKLVAEFPKSEADAQALSESRYALGTLLARTPSRKGEDEQFYRDALQTQRTLVSNSRGSSEARVKLGRYLNNLGILLNSTDRAADAKQAFREAMQVEETLSKATPSLPGPRWQVARSGNNLAGLLLRENGSRREAEALLRRSDELLRTLGDEFSNVPQYQQERASVASNLGFLAQLEGRRRDAETFYRRTADLLGALVNRFPKMPEYRQKLAVADLNLALSLADPKGPEADRLSREALSAQERLVTDYPDVPEYADALGRCLYDLALIQVDRNRPAEARPQLERAIEQHQKALAAVPENRIYRDHLAEDRGVLALVLLKSGDHAQAARVADSLPATSPDDLKSYLRAAEFLAQCLSAAGRDPALSADQRREKQEDYAARAVAALRRASERSLLDGASSLRSPQFEPLRDRPDFRRLVEEPERRPARDR